MVPAGTLVVKTAQPLGHLAVGLLEPRSEDGLATWNFLDAGLKAGDDFPVMRLPKPAPMYTTGAEPLPEDRGSLQPITLASAGGGGGRGRGGFGFGGQRAGSTASTGSRPARAGSSSSTPGPAGRSRSSMSRR